MRGASLTCARICRAILKSGATPTSPTATTWLAALMYTSAKDGDKGTFLDLKFVGGKLVSWQEADHTMPAKGHTGIGMNIGGGSIGNGTATTPGAVHY